jgi:aryl-alcohol dehydrogenase-like predicted oxidoreductase
LGLNQLREVSLHLKVGGRNTEHVKESIAALRLKLDEGDNEAIGGVAHLTLGSPRIFGG